MDLKEIATLKVADLKDRLEVCVSALTITSDFADTWSPNKRSEGRVSRQA